MKYLSDYTNKALSALFNKTGAFFAFSQKQFNEQKKDGVIYVNLGAGFICPKANVDELVAGLKEIKKGSIAKDIKENGIEAIIERELNNYECFYTGDISDAVDALKDYFVTRDQVVAVFNKVIKVQQ